MVNITVLQVRLLYRRLLQGQPCGVGPDQGRRVLGCGQGHGVRGGKEGGQDGGVLPAGQDRPDGVLNPAEVHRGPALRKEGQGGGLCQRLEPNQSKLLLLLF